MSVDKKRRMIKDSKQDQGRFNYSLTNKIWKIELPNQEWALKDRIPLRISKERRRWITIFWDIKCKHEEPKWEFLSNRKGWYNGSGPFNYKLNKLFEGTEIYNVERL